MVLMPSRVACVLPKVFFKVVSVSPIRRSQKPPNHGARFGINLHSTPLRARVSDTSTDEKKFFRSSAVAVKVELLSEIKSLGTDLLPANLRNAQRKLSAVRSGTTSKCIAREIAQVNKQR